MGHWTARYLLLASTLLWTTLAQPAPLQLYLELLINQQVTGRIVSVTADGEHLFMQRSDLQAAGLPIPDGPQPLDLRDLPDVDERYDAASQRLYLTVPSAWLPHQQVHGNVDTSRTRARPQRSPGALFNYDAFYSNTDGGSQFFNTWLEQRGFGRWGALSNTGVYRHRFSGNDTDDGYIRYDTQWRYNRQDQMLSYQAGDLISGALTWSRAVRMGGLQIRRNFGLRPDLITYPLPQYSADAAVPSSVELFVDNALLAEDTLAPGPFTVSAQPFISGAGQATVVTTDALGRQVATTVPFYVTDQLLRPGLTDFSLSAGALRQDYGLQNAAYDTAALSTSVRHGLTSHLTLEGHAEAAEDFHLLGLGSTAALGVFGTLNAAVSQSQLDERGAQYTLGYSYYARRAGITLQRIERDAQFADLSVVSALDAGLLGNFLTTRSDQLAVTVSPPGWGSFGAGYFANQTAEGENNRLLNLSWSRSLWDRASVYLSVNRQLDTGDVTAQAQLIVPFDLHATGSAGIERDAQGDHRTRLGYSRTAPSDGGVGWNLAYARGTSDYYQADLMWRTAHGLLQAGAYSDDGQTTHWAGASGSVVALDNAWFASNRIDDAFVLVSTNGYADVPVRFEHQPLGRTDSGGHLLVPWVPSYYRGQYEIDLLGLPGNVQTTRSIRHIAVEQDSGAVLDFSLRRVVAANIALIDEAGNPVARGARVVEEGSDKTAQVGWDGLVYLEGLAEQNRLRVSAPEQPPCSVTFTLQPSEDQISQIGPLVCQPERQP